MMLNRLVNLFRKNKEWDEAWKYRNFGVRRDKPDSRDLIFEEIYNMPTPVKNIKCNYYRGKEND